MASPIIGRTPCPECGFARAHVKKSEKVTFRYCPECSSQHHARTERQVADLLAKTELIGAPAPPTPPSPSPTQAPSPTPSPTATPPVASPSPTPAPRRSSLFGL